MMTDQCCRAPSDRLNTAPRRRTRLAPAAALALGLAVIGACDRTPDVQDVQPREFPETGATVVTVRGRRFGSKTRVTVNGSVLPATTVVDATTLRVTLPPSKPGVVRIGAVTLPDNPSPSTVAAAYVDVTPPQVIGWQPAGTLPPTAVTERIRVTFSEPIVRGSVDLLDDTGAAVPGATDRAGALLTFTASDALRAGRGYVVSVHGVTDARGNEAPPERLRFSIGADE